MQCETMNRKTLTMNWDGLREDDEDDHFFEPSDRTSLAAPSDLCSSDDDTDFEDSRMSFTSTVSSASFKSSKAPSMASPPSFNSSKSSSMTDYNMWMSEPGDIKERRKRLFEGMGLSSSRNMLRIASTKLAGALSRKHISVDPPAESKPAMEVVKPITSPKKESRTNEPPSSSQLPAIVLVRSRSDGDIDAFSARTKQRKEELIGPVSKQRLTRTLSGGLTCQYSSSTVKVCPERSKTRLSLSLPKPNNDVLQSVVSDSGFGSFFLIKNLDTGKEFIVKEYNEQGMWNKLSDVQTGKQMTMEEFEKSVGYSPAVKQLMRRKNITNTQDVKKLNYNSSISKSFRNSKKRGAAILKNIKGVASSRSFSSKDQPEQSSLEDQQKGSTKVQSNWVKVKQHGKPYKEFTALHVSQEIQAHQGSIWMIKFSFDARYLASGGEDKVIHVWEVQECDVMSTRTSDDLSSVSGTLVHTMAGIVSDRPPLAEITPVPSEKKRKGKNGKKKGDSMPEYVDVPETGFALSEKPVCSFTGHQDEVLDLAWSKSQLLLSSSMDKTVRLWDLETKSCLKMFSHNDYVTCIQFNPVDDNYFISGSLDAKVRIWNVPDRQVVDWTDAREMVTAASYTPDGQGAIIGTRQGICRFYSIDIDDCKLEHNLEIQMKTKSQSKKLPGSQAQLQVKKITGFQFAPWNPSEVLITSTDSRIRIHNGPELIQKYRGSGFRNISSQISASFSPDGKHVISASEDSQVYIWKVAESKNDGKRSKITVQAHEHFQCKDVTAAIAWPGNITKEPPIIELHSKRHSKRLTSPTPNSPTHGDREVGTSSRRHLPPLPKKSTRLERIDSIGDDDFSPSARIDPGIGVSDSFHSSSASISYRDSPSISGSSPSRSFFDNGGHTVQATAWGMVIVTASLEGEIRVYHNFGLPRKARRQSNLFGD